MSIKHTIITTTIAALTTGIVVGFTAGWSIANQDDDAAKLRKEISTAALDYPEGWYTGDSERMSGRLHLELRKRIVMQNPSTSEWVLREMTAEQLTEATKRGGGTRVAEDERRADVQVLDVFGDIASVRITMKDWVDYLHMARIDGEWKIINVLWDFNPEVKAQQGRD